MSQTFISIRPDYQVNIAHIVSVRTTAHGLMYNLVNGYDVPVQAAPGKTPEDMLAEFSAILERMKGLR